MLILHLLAEQPRYGYQLVQAIKAATAGKLEFGEGCVYPILHRLEADGLLGSRRESVGGRNRVVYCVTARGAARLEESRGAWMQVVDAVERAFRGDADARPALA